MLSKNKMIKYGSNLFAFCHKTKNDCAQMVTDRKAHSFWHWCSRWSFIWFMITWPVILCLPNVHKIEMSISGLLCSLFACARPMNSLHACGLNVIVARRHSESDCFSFAENAFSLVFQKKHSLSSWTCAIATKYNISPRFPFVEWKMWVNARGMAQSGDTNILVFPAKTEVRTLTQQRHCVQHH